MARASGLGPESREFESLHSDHLSVGSVAASAGVCKTLTQKHRWFESTPADQNGEVTLMVRERFAKPSVALKAWRFKSSSLRQHGWLPKWLYRRGPENRCGESPVGSNPTPSANLLQYPNPGRGNGLRHHQVQVRVLSGAPLYLVRLKQRTRSYGLRNAGWNPARDTNMILSSNW